MEVGSHIHHTPSALSPGVRAPRTNWIGSWLGARPSLHAVANTKSHIIPLLKIEPLSSSPQPIFNSDLATTMELYLTKVAGGLTLAK